MAETPQLGADADKLRMAMERLGAGQMDEAWSGRASLRGCFRSYSGRCLSPEHDMSHGYVHPRLGGFGQGLLMLAQPAAPAKPGQGPFHPASGATPQSRVLWDASLSPKPS